MASVSAEPVKKDYRLRGVELFGCANAEQI
jgi:hypothetical protein